MFQHEGASTPRGGWLNPVALYVVVAMVAAAFSGFANACEQEGIYVIYRQAGGSMLPAIAIGEILTVNYAAYGIRIAGSDFVLCETAVQPGDVVVFPSPSDPSVDYVKRVIAVGGQSIEVHGTQVIVNGTPLYEPYAFFDPEVVEEFHRQGRDIPDVGPFRVGEGEVFVMGDNRFNSADSRRFGPILARAIRGRVVEK